MTDAETADPIGPMPVALRTDLGAYVLATGFFGERPVFACGDGTVRFADPDHRVVAHEGTMLAAVFARDSVVTAGDDGRVVRVTADGRATELADVGRRWVDRLAVGPSDAVAFASGRQVWALASGKRKAEFTEGSAVGGLAFAPKGLRLAVARAGGVSLRSFVQGPPETLEWKGGHTGVTFSPDGVWVVTTMQEPTLHLWRLGDDTQLRMAGYTGKVRSVSWAPKGRYLATSGAGGAMLWPFLTQDGPAGEMATTLAPRSVLSTAVSCHPAEDLVAVGYADGAVVLAVLDQSGDVTVRFAKKAQVTALAWSPGGHLLAWGTEAGEAGVIEVG